MTDISTLGEFGLIDRMTEGLELRNASTLRGVGDDCAVLQYSSEAADPDDFWLRPTCSWRAFTSTSPTRLSNTWATKRLWSTFLTFMP